jgi:hypothetical protein
MSKKSKVSAERNEDWLQIGNFLIGQVNNNIGTRMCAKSVSGEWSVSWGEGSMMYGVMLSFAADVNTHRYLEALLTLMYVATTYPHDLAAVCEKQQLPVINGFCQLVNEQTRFEVSLMKKPTEKEDEEALNGVAEMQEIIDELGMLDMEIDDQELAN